MEEQKIKDTIELSESNESESDDSLIVNNKIAKDVK